MPDQNIHLYFVYKLSAARDFAHTVRFDAAIAPLFLKSIPPMTTSEILMTSLFLDMGPK